MEIKNSLINTKEYKNKQKLNKKMKKKALKYKNIDIKKCSRLEQSLFGPLTFDDKTTKNDKNKFIKFNKNITLLYLFPKSESNNLCSKFQKMFFENPLESNIFSTVIDNKFTEIFKHYDNFHNYSSFGHVGYIEPKSISKYVDFMNILLFNFSRNYFGIAFECELNNDILLEINNTITCDINDYSEYKQYYVGSKKYVGRYEWNPDIVRNNNLNNTLIEIKVIINEFINSYLKFENKLTYVPISLNIYETNYEISDRPAPIMLSHYMYGYTNEHRFEKFSIWEHIPNKSDKHYIDDICFESYQNFDNLDRSANIYIHTSSDKRNLFITPESLINIYICILQFYKNIEFESLISEERDNIFNIYSKKNSKKIYKSYSEFITSALKYKALFESVVLSNHYYTNDYLNNVCKTQKHKSNELIDDCKSLEKYFTDKLAIENINETRKVSKLSLVIAILSILIAIIPLIYNNSRENTIDDVSSENKYNINKTINSINSTLIKSENDINKYNNSN